MQRASVNSVLWNTPRFLVWMILALLPTEGALMAQTVPSRPARAAYPGTSPRSGSYRIAGTVVNRMTGETVRRATVAVLAEADNHTVESVTSDSEGRFALERLPAAKYQLTASKRGFRTAYYDEHEDFTSAIVTGPDQDTEHLVFRLTPGASLRGVIAGDGGDPVEGARVMLFERPQHHRPGERTTQIDAAATDDTGAYEFSNLAAGEYLLAVVAEPWYALHGPRPLSAAGQKNENTAALDVAYPISYYDSTTDESSATPIVLAAGSQETADFNLHAMPALHLSVEAPRKRDGSIARPELRQMIFGTQISAESAGFLDAIQTGTTEFIGVAPGHYELAQGDPPRIAALDVSASQDVDSTAGTPALTVEGTLRMTNGLPAPEGVNLTLDLMDGGQGRNQFVAVAQNGRFKFDPVQQGTWSLWAWMGDKMLPIVSTASGGAARSGNLLTVRDRSVRLQVTLSEGETLIEGFALKGAKGVAGAMVVLAPKDIGAWQALARRDQSDSDGSFALRDVAPGQYTVVAIEDGWELDWSRPEVISRYLHDGTAVSVTGNSGTLVRLGEPVKVEPR